MIEKLVRCAAAAASREFVHFLVVRRQRRTAMKKQHVGSLAAASAGVISMLGLTAPSHGIVIGNFETGLDKWEAVDATGLTPVTGIGNTLGSFSLKLETPPSFHQSIIRSFAGSDAET